MLSHRRRSVDRAVRLLWLVFALALIVEALLLCGAIAREIQRGGMVPVDFASADRSTHSAGLHTRLVATDVAALPGRSADAPLSRGWGAAGSPVSDMQVRHGYAGGGLGQETGAAARFFRGAS